MQTTWPQGISAALSLLRWGARILTVPILLFYGWFLIAHLVGEANPPSRPLVWQDAAILTTLIVSLAGLAVAWKWELLGGTVALAAVSACALLNWGVLAFPGSLILVAAVMFLASGWLSRLAQIETVRRPN